jgi:hypothetical protein
MEILVLETNIVASRLAAGIDRFARVAPLVAGREKLSRRRMVQCRTKGDTRYEILNHRLLAKGLVRWSQSADAYTSLLRSYFLDLAYMSPQHDHHSSLHTQTGTTIQCNLHTFQEITKRAGDMPSHHLDPLDPPGPLACLGYLDPLCLLELLLLDAACLAACLSRLISALLQSASCSAAGSHSMTLSLTLVKMLRSSAWSHKVRKRIIDDLPSQLLCHVLFLQLLRHTPLLQRLCHTSFLQISNL